MQKHVELSKEFKSVAVEKISKYFLDNFERGLSNFAAELFLEFLAAHIGELYYNQGVVDSQQYMIEKVEDLYGLVK